MLPEIRKAGLHTDAVFGSLDKVGWKRLDKSTRKWVKSRYRKACPGCGKWYWTSPKTLPLCGGCWATLELPVRQWWWVSKRTQRTLEKLLDAWFEGGYEVAEDPRQLVSSCIG